MERIHIHYFGNDISKEDKARVKADISYHMGNAPSDASACCCISNEKEGYACNLKIHSAKGHLFIHRESKDLGQLLQYVYDSLDRSMKEWHKDPDHFVKAHPMTKVPCRSASHKNLICPLESYSAENNEA